MNVYNFLKYFSEYITGVLLLPIVYEKNISCSGMSDSL